MLIALLIASTLIPDEVELVRRVPHVFERAEAQYRLMVDAMAGHPSDSQPRTLANGELKVVRPKDWCSGFFPGSLWYLYEYTGDEFWKTQAKSFTERLIEPLRHDANNHDVGFRTYCSAGNALRLTGDARYADFLHDTAAALRTRYNRDVGVICSWPPERNKGTGFFGSSLLVIVDNMMNLELLEWDAKHGGSPESDVIARSQADI